LTEVHPTNSKLTQILDESVSRGEMALSDAKDIARKALFSNSNTLYNLKLKLRLSEPGPPLLTAVITAETKVDALTERTIADFFTQKGIDLVRIQWVDYCNMIVSPHKNHYLSW
jgi:hypothetical protein